ncbi:MAG: hypothetical protein QOH06_4555 [Acidobacteriota bacterium]|jgi:hypothetical protein|nr:hypothetical protein [Acidobacteriota bacterium]
MKRHHFVPVDFANLMDSTGIADQRGGRIRLSDRSAVGLFMEENGLEAPRFQEFVLTHSLPKATIISSGLMKGLFAYDVESKRAFAYIASDRGFDPLRKYDGTICYDIALSYASEERDKLALPLKAELEKLGVSVYLLDVAHHPNEPLWSIRFREGLFYSRFFVPILTEDYLARSGTAVELFDIARATVEHRKDEMFYPMIPLVRDSSELRERVFSHRGASAGQFDAESFEWVRTHIFTVSLAKGIPWLARFFSSLAHTARGQFDSGFLDCLAPSIDWIELFKLKEGAAAKILIRNPILTHHHFVLFSNGVIKYYGMGEPSPQARLGRDFPDPARTILEWLALEHTEDERASQRTEEAPPQASMSWFCPHCHSTAPPAWKSLDVDRMKELGIILRFSQGLPMCGRCGRTTMIER